MDYKKMIFDLLDKVKSEYTLKRNKLFFKGRSVGVDFEESVGA